MIIENFKEPIKGGFECEQLAEQHWKYIGALLKCHGISPPIIEYCHFHYVSAFVHGYKHGIEYCDEKARQEDLV